MKVTSPVGEFPFTITRIRVHRRGLVASGEMGRWPASVEINLPGAAALQKYAALAVAAAVVAACAGRLRYRLGGT